MSIINAMKKDSQMSQGVQQASSTGSVQNTQVVINLTEGDELTMSIAKKPKTSQASDASV
eukprot:437067-Amphidinium_carterae.1